jgi:hypothetical protein
MEAFTIENLSFDNHHPKSVLVRVAPLYVPSVCVDSTPPRVNYVASYPRCSIASEQEPVGPQQLPLYFYKI